MKSKILNNIEIKILSVIIALTLWVLVRGEQSADVFLNVKVEGRNLPNYLVITSQSSERINLHIKGPRSLISKIDKRYFKPYLCDLGGTSPGKIKCEVLTSKFSTEKNVSILDISPKSVTFELDLVAKKEVPVEPSFMGKLERGYEIEEYTVYPKSLEIIGPKTKTKDVASLKTAPIDLAGRKRSFVDKLPVILPDKSISIAGTSDEVLVNIRIREEKITRLVEKIPVRIKHLEKGWELETAFVDVTISGPAGKVNDIKREEIEVIAEQVEDSDSNDGRSEAKVTITEIPGVVLSKKNAVYVVRKGKGIPR